MDRCVFFSDLMSIPQGRQRSYSVHESPTGLACIDATLRIGDQWCFARRWVRTAASLRELYRFLDRLEARGFRFRVFAGTGRAPSKEELDRVRAELGELRLRARDFHSGLSDEEKRIHSELFPDEASLLGRGYDWDSTAVYRDGTAMEPDEHGRLLEVDADIVYEWVRVDDEFTWRRYPLERVRPTLTVSRT